MPFLKVDKGLADEADGVQVMKPMPDLDALLARAVAKGMFGTKMRSVIKLADADGRRRRRRPAVRGRPADPGRRPRADHRARGRHPQPREGRGRGAAQGGDPRQLDALGADQQVMLKLTLPERRRLLRRARRAPERAAGRRPLRRLLPRRGQRPPGPQPRRDRQLLAGPDRGPHARSRATTSSTPTLDASIKSIYEASIT